MTNTIVILAAFALLNGCSKPSAPARQQQPSQVAGACNQVTPNLGISAMMRGASVPASTLPTLGGGPMAAGVFDLASGEQFDGAPSWEDTHSVTVRVSNGTSGTQLDWAQLAGPNQATRSDWNAKVKTKAPATLTFTCGRTGASTFSYASYNGELHLRMPDPSGTGMLDLVFVAHQP